MNTGVQNPSPVGEMGVMLKLHAALGISPGDVAAFVGAGGKAAAIIAVSGGLTQEGMKVHVAPTTKRVTSEAELIGPLVTSEDAGDLRAKAERALSEAPAVVVGSGMLSKNRVGGVDPGWVGDLATLADVVLVEADGSRRRPIKGTADHEPAIPEVAALVVARGSLARVPQRARTAALITGVVPGRIMSDASVITRELWRLGVRDVVLASLPTESPGRVWIP